MAKHSGVWCGLDAVLWVGGFASLLTACAPRLDAPAPVVSGEVSTAAVQPVQIRVQRGQTLSGIAHTYHVPMQVIAEANHLPPPYNIQAGNTLIIPDADQPSGSPATVSVAALPSVEPERAAAVSPPQALPPEHPPPTAAVQKPSVPAAAPPIPAAVPPPASDAARPDADPAAAAGVHAAAPEPPPSTLTPTSPPSGSGTFLWPVRGRILASYGSGADGTHNDGINIAAPRGAAVEAADAGVVAYAGNELRGYGNLVLIKHANGWISAYAHCDLILVKRGEKVARGQVIARVGATGNVGEPQLHFELRRGNKPVDPREFLAPLPTAGMKYRQPG